MFSQLFIFFVTDISWLGFTKEAAPIFTSEKKMNKMLLMHKTV